MEFIRRHKIDLIIFAVALIARLVLFGINLHAEHGNLINTIHGDDGYYELSRNVAAGHGFTGEEQPPYVPNTLRTPGYILFIAGLLWLTQSYLVVILVQIILGACIPVLGRHLALKIVPRGSEKLAWWVGIGMALEPYLVLFSSIFYTETLFIFLFLLCLLALISYLEKGSYRLLLMSGVLFGLATLTKTTVQYLPFLIAPLLFYRFRRQLSVKENIMRIGAFIALYLVVLSPWLYRNLETFGSVGLSAQPAYNLYVYLVPSVLALEHGSSFTTELTQFTTEAESSGRAITLKNSPAYEKKAVIILAEHPKGLLLSLGVTLIAFFTHDGFLTVLQHAGYTPSQYLGTPALSLLISSPLHFVTVLSGYIESPFVLVLLFRILWIGITIFVIVGLVSYMNSTLPREIVWLILLLIVYFVATSMVGGLGVSARYRMPIDPIIFTLAAYGMVLTKNAILRGRK